MEVAPQPVFPAGLRVLVVDDDPLALRVVEKMLILCEYQGAPSSSRVHPPTDANLALQPQKPLLFLLFCFSRGGGAGAGGASAIGHRTAPLDPAVVVCSRREVFGEARLAFRRLPSRKVSCRTFRKDNSERCQKDHLKR
jgi:hypothetical protein